MMLSGYMISIQTIVKKKEFAFNLKNVCDI